MILYNNVLHCIQITSEVTIYTEDPWDGGLLPGGTTSNTTTYDGPTEQYEAIADHCLQIFDSFNNLIFEKTGGLTPDASAYYSQLLGYDYTI